MRNNNLSRHRMQERLFSRYTVRVFALGFFSGAVLGMIALACVYYGAQQLAR